MPKCNPATRTKLAEEAGRIADIAQTRLLTGDDTYAFQRIPETSYDPTLGENPRGIIFHNIPPLRTKYKPLVNSGTENSTVTDPLTGATRTVAGDKLGRILGRGEKVEHGYEERTRCLRGKPWEAGPYNLFDLIHKRAVKPWLDSLRRDIPRFAKEEFHAELLDLVFTAARYKYSVTADVARSSNAAGFLAVPTGGANIGVFQHAANLAMYSGWGTGGKMATNRPMFEVYLGREDIDFAIRTYKKDNLGLVLEGSVGSNDGRFVKDADFGEVQEAGGIKLINAKLPKRGILLPTTGGYVIEEIRSFTVETGVEGLILRENPEFTAGYVMRNGIKIEVVSIGYSIDPSGMAMERQVFSPVPTLGTGATPRPNNFEVSLLPEWDAIYDDANTDGWLVAFRATHVFAPYIQRPELMTAFVFIAATPQVVITNPVSNAAASTATSVTMKPPFDARADTYVPCAEAVPARDATNPSCSDIFPTNGVGVINLPAQLADVEEGSTITIVVQRTGGSSGAATIAYATSNGTATAGTEYTAASGTLSWADGEAGVRTFNIVTISTGGNDDGKTITVTLSGVTGATLGTPNTMTVTINDVDAA